MINLPVDARVAEIVATIREHRAAVIVAPPGAGKTTRVPPALVDDGKIIVLQPRRVAARSLARRIAAERGWTLGDEVGWHVRFDRKFSKETRLLIATEGILTARLQSDPLLTEFTTVVIDEFHERSIHADLALALARQAMLARDDLRLVVMSATLAAEPVSRYLGGAPVIEIDARVHPVTIEHRAEAALRDVVRDALESEQGDVLVFLPGAPEIRRAADELRGIGAAIYPLHGSLSPEEQDAAILPVSGQRRVILATNLAETSLTIEGIRTVVDTGLQKVLRYDPATGIDRLETERIARDSAEQRAGRAGRTAPGRAIRLWDPRQEMRDHREPEIERVDLAPPFLDVYAWGGDPRTFGWFEAPSEEGAARAAALLEDLGAVADGRITATGRRMAVLPLHPRLARVVIDAPGQEAAAACAILTDGMRWAESRSEIDLLDLVARIGEAPPAVRRAADEIARVAATRGTAGEERLRLALFHAYADRLALRREESDRFVLANGTGAVLPRGAALSPEIDLVVAVDLLAPRRGLPDAVIRLLGVVDRAWVRPNRTDRVEAFDPESRSVRGREVERFHEIVVRERNVKPDPQRAAELLGAVLRDEMVSDENAVRWLRRAGVAGVDLDVDAIVAAAAAGRTTLPPLRLGEWIDGRTKSEIERWAPDALAVPSGRSRRLDYRADGSVVLAVKLQELFGLAESPRAGRPPRPVTFELLSPSGRPVQTTTDLRSFWDGAYHEVRRELRGRYPKHPWPEDPWNAPPTARTKRKS
ncbi:MAG: ATP-dependent RNA helicase [Thermoanaerobaculia bacterium]